MNENISLIEILKDCPKGTKLYSPLFGDVRLHSIQEASKYPIYITTCIGDRLESFTESGLFIHQCPGECMLFPSKELRDWSTFKVPKEEKVPKKEYEFKPFDKVLVRNTNTELWRLDLFSNLEYVDDHYIYICFRCEWNQCIPYEGNEHLFGTNNSPE